MEGCWPFDAAFTKLDLCYERLLQVIKSPESDAEQITELVAEAAAVIAGLPDLPETAENSEYHLRLVKLAAKLQQVIALAETEKNQLYQAVKALKTGKNAINSYRPPAVGMGYSEGKFLDQKK